MRVCTQRHWRWLWVLCFGGVVVWAHACTRTTSLIDGTPDGGAGATDAWYDFADADPADPDAGPSPGCVPGGTACNNCVDDDGDGAIDGDDPECTGAIDDDESSFATGIPGDNQDAVKQDCFFDGDSGSGNDGCDIHVCCLLTGPCPAELRPNQYDPADCTPSDTCVANCEPLTPPGCDCFGCCTVCNDVGCFDVITSPKTAPECTGEVADDPSRCPRCTPSSDCGTPCEPDGCVLCPGQDPADLPPECGDGSCPAGLTTCAGQSDCNADQYCVRGCCINAID